MATGLRQAEQRETSIDGRRHLTALPRLRHRSADAQSGRVLKLGLQCRDPGMSAPEVVCVCTAVLLGGFIPQGSL